MLRNCVNALLAGSLVITAARAQHSIIDSGLADAYFFVDHYEIVIDRPPDAVWPHAIDLASWMGLTHDSGPIGEAGEVFRLYEGEDFFFEVTKLIPDRLLIGIIRPFNVEGEESVGMGMLVLTNLGDTTLVSNFMSRHFAWLQEAPNPLRQRRESREYVELNQSNQTAALARLKRLAEDDPP